MRTLSGVQSKPNLKLQAVVFDCDGILVDSEPLHYQAFQEVLVPLGLGHSYEAYMEHYVGFDDRDAFVYAFKTAERELGKSALNRLVESKSESLKKILRKGVPGFPGVVELVRELQKADVPLAVASGARRDEIELFIASMGLNGAFKTIAAADDVKKSKPDPETYLLAVEKLGRVLGAGPLSPQRCIAIEDTAAGIRSAKSAGLAVVAVTNSFPAADLAEADMIAGSLLELSFAKMVSLIESLHRV